MKYKIIKLLAHSGEIIDIPDGYIPIKYGYIWNYGEPPVRELTVLQPIEEEKGEEEKCFFCDKNMTRDKIGIRPICPICLTVIYKMAKESHKSSEC